MDKRDVFLYFSNLHAQKLKKAYEYKVRLTPATMSLPNLQKKKHPMALFRLSNIFYDHLAQYTRRI